MAKVIALGSAPSEEVQTKGKFIAVGCGLPGRLLLVQAIGFFRGI